MRFRLGTAFRIGETAVAEWMDVDCEDKAIWLEAEVLIETEGL
jgi:hypothetical protein